MTNQNRYPIHTLALIAGTGGLSWAMAAYWVYRSQKRLAHQVNPHSMTGLLLGCRPGPGLERRVQGAVDLYTTQRLHRLVISGRGEAEAAMSSAISQGIPRDRIQLELMATSTYENLQFAMPLLESDPFWIISDRWHLPRALWIAKDLGLSAHPHAVRPPENKSREIRSLGREGMSVLNRLIARRRGLLNGADPTHKVGRVDP